MVEIIPAILTDDINDVHEKLHLIENDTTWVQIDFMDGKFVPTRSINITDLQGLQTPANLEAHLMVQEPEQYFNDCVRAGFERVIFHFEATTNASTAIQALRELNVEIGIAINPGTDVSVVLPYRDEIDLLLLLGVHPGKQAQTFIPQTLEKIKEAKTQFPKTLIAVDGGINKENIKDVINAGADICCIGSAIVKTQNPKEALQLFQKQAKEERFK